MHVHEVVTVNDLGWNGLRNGALIQAAIREGIELLLTIDKNILHQQRIDRLPIIVVVFDATSSKVEDLVPFVPAFLEKLPEFTRGQVHVLSL